MKLVQPIRDREKIEQMKKELMKDSYRNYMLFVIGINTGLRISDILTLKVSDVRDRTHIVIKEIKRKKDRRFLVNGQLREEINRYVEDMKDEQFLFDSRNGDNKAITRQQAYNILNKAAEVVGIEEVGTHTLRKTFGYWHYKQNKDVALLQDIFQHSAPSVTLRYIGINQDIMDMSIENFFL